MKDFLVLLGMVILGVYIAINLILGSGTTSMKTGTNQIGVKMTTDLNKYTSDTTTP